MPTFVDGTRKNWVYNMQDGNGEQVPSAVYVNEQDGNGERLVWQAALMIDSFEHNDIGTYYDVPSTGGTASTTSDSDARHGDSYLILDGYAHIHSMPDQHELNYPLWGDSMEIWTKQYNSENAGNPEFGRFNFFVQQPHDHSSGSTCYRVQLCNENHPDDPWWHINKMVDGTEQDYARDYGISGAANGSWYKIEIDTHINSSDEGVITARLYDATETQIGSEITFTDTTPITTEGGVEIWDNGNIDTKWDKIQITDRNTQTLADGESEIEIFTDTSWEDRWPTTSNPGDIDVRAANAKEGNYGMEMLTFASVKSYESDNTLPNYVHWDDEWEISFRYDRAGSSPTSQIRWAINSDDSQNYYIDIYQADGRLVIWDQNDWQDDVYVPDGIFSVGNWYTIEKYNITDGMGFIIYDGAGNQLASTESTAYDMSYTDAGGVRVANQTTGDGDMSWDDWIVYK